MTTPTTTDQTTSAQDNEVRTVSFVSLGCPKNLVDSEKMLGTLAESGLVIVSAGAGANTEELEQDHSASRQQDGSGDHIDIDDADAVVINTCGFLEASKNESLAVIRSAVRAKEQGRVKRVVVAGCLVQRHRAKVLEWEPGIDALIGVFDRDRVTDAVTGKAPHRATLADASDHPAYWISGNALVAAKDRGINTTNLTVHGKDGSGVGYFEDDSARLRLTNRHYAYLRVSEGCNQACAFCTIPSIRGKMRSKPLERIAAEATELLRDGAFELNLIGQDTTSFGDDIGIGFNEHTRDGGLSKLLRTVCSAMDDERVKGWVRLMYAYPSNFHDHFIDTIAELSILNQGRLLPYIDIPLQHASDNMLTAMRRNVTADHQRDLMRKLRDRVPGIAIRTTMISGFPGETEDDHRQLLEFIEEVGFEALGVFEYSREDATPAGTMEQDPALAVDPETKARRKAEIMQLQQELAFEQARFLADQFDTNNPDDSGVRVDILIDQAGTPDSPAVGRAYWQAPQIDAVTYVQSNKPLAPGELVPCVITDADGYDLIATPTDQATKRVSLNVL